MSSSLFDTVGVWVSFNAMSGELTAENKCGPGEARTRRQMNWDKPVDK